MNRDGEEATNTDGSISMATARTCKGFLKKVQRGR